MKYNKNYILAFLACISCTILTAMGDMEHIKWLILSDINVAIWLTVAWMFDFNEKTIVNTTYNINKKSD